LIIALISWGIGAILSLPVGRILCVQVGIIIAEAPITYIFSWSGLLIWLSISLGLAILASLLPAQQAVNLTIHETLAYE